MQMSPDKVIKQLPKLPSPRHSPIPPTRFKPSPIPSPLPLELLETASEIPSKWSLPSTQNPPLQMKPLQPVPMHQFPIPQRMGGPTTTSSLQIPSTPGSSKTTIPTSLDKLRRLSHKPTLHKPYAIPPTRSRPSSTHSLRAVELA